MNRRAMSPVLIALGVVLGCGLFGATKQEVEKSGRLEFVKSLKYGSVGTHGSQGWYVSNRELRVNDRRYTPPEIDVNDDIASCEADPVAGIEALRCVSYSDSKETAYALTIRDDKPVWSVAYSEEYNGKSHGEWSDDGRFLIFKDHLFELATGERQPVIGAPDYPYDSFRSLSPDGRTIVYQGCCFLEIKGDPAALIDLKRQVREKSRQPENKRIEMLWIIDTSTGKTDMLELSRDKYDWLVWDQDRWPRLRDWLSYYRQKLTWQKDENGHYLPVPSV